jgi:Ethanolamine utilization protein EutJ (predicted chaperonin)
MKLNLLKKIIAENLKSAAPELISSPEETPKFPGINQIKDFFVVTMPGSSSPESSVRRANVFDDIPMNGTHGVYLSEAEATRESKRLTQEYSSQLKELEDTMAEVRAQEAELKERKK